MEVLNISATSDSPAIYFDADQGKFQIIGNSMPENASGFYTPAIEWLKKYEESPNSKTEFLFKMNLLNTSSTKIFADIFNLIKIISEKSEVNIIWYYNYGDDDIQEVGADFKSFIKVPFEFVAIKE